MGRGEDGETWVAGIEPRLGPKGLRLVNSSRVTCQAAGKSHVCPRVQECVQVLERRRGLGVCSF